MWLTNLLRPSVANRFYGLLRDQAQLLCAAAEKLKAQMATGDARIADDVHEIENQGDKLVQKMIEALQNTFVTPIDRQDLYSVSEAIDTMLDYVNNASRELKLFGIEATPAISQMGDVIAEAANDILDAITWLPRDAAHASDSARAASHCEHRVEDIYRRTIAVLFDGPDLRLALKHREIYRHLSNSADRADAIGRLIIKIVVKTT